VTTETQTPEQIEQESNAAFAAGFGEVRPNEHTSAAATPAEPAPAAAAPAAEPTPAAAPAEPAAAEATGTASAPATATPDEWAGVPPKVKAELESLHAAITAVTGERLRKIDGHIGNLTNVTKDLQAALVQAKTTTQAKGAEAPSNAQVSAAIRDPEKWARLKEDFPDWAEAMEPELADIRSQLDKLNKAASPVDTTALRTEIVGEVDKRLPNVTKDAVSQARTLAYLDFKHGTDWEARIGSKAFEDWYKTQPAETRALSASANVSDASKLIGLYDEHLKKAAATAENKKRLDRAVQPQGVPVATAAVEDPEKAFEQGFHTERAGGG
jgi:hypothetical protein